jgi:TolB-like protein
MTTTPMMAVAAALALALAAGPARAAGPAEEAARVARSLAQQLRARPPQPPLSSIAMAPPRAPGPVEQQGLVRVFAELLAGELTSATGLGVRDWKAVDQAAREQALRAAAAGGFGLPAVPGVQALLVTEATGAGGDAPARLQLRLVAVPGGAVLASESGRLEPPDRASSGAVTAVGVDVAMRRLADQLAVGFAKMPGSARYRRLAVLPFAEVGPEARKRELGALVSAELSTDLRQNQGLLLVERARVGALMAEMKLGEMGVVDPATAPRLGKLADAQALVLGTVADAGDRFLVNARVVATETAETLSSASESVSAGTLIALSSEAVVLRSKKDAVFRSLLVPGWGQAYNRQPVKSAVFGALAAGTVGTALWFHLQGAKAQRDYDRLVTAGQLGSDPAGRAAALRADAEGAYRTRNGFLWAAAGVWVVNVADAYLFGIDGDRVVDGVALAPRPGGLQLALAGRF